MKTSHSSPNRLHANASEEPHWPAPGLGGELVDARLLVRVRLRHRRVRLVRAGRRDALVLVVDARRRPERLLEAAGAVQRRRPPELVGLADRLGDLDERLGRDLLEDELHREDRAEVGRPRRLLRLRDSAAGSGRRGCPGSCSPSAWGSRPRTGGTSSAGRALRDPTPAPVARGNAVAVLPELDVDPYSDGFLAGHAVLQDRESFTTTAGVQARGARARGRCCATMAPACTGASGRCSPAWKARSRFGTTLPVRVTPRRGSAGSR